MLLQTFKVRVMSVGCQGVKLLSPGETYLASVVKHVAPNKTVLVPQAPLALWILWTNPIWRQLNAWLFRFLEWCGVAYLVLASPWTTSVVGLLVVFYTRQTLVPGGVKTLLPSPLTSTFGSTLYQKCCDAFHCQIKYFISFRFLFMLNNILVLSAAYVQVDSQTFNTS